MNEGTLATASAARAQQEHYRAAGFTFQERQENSPLGRHGREAVNNVVVRTTTGHGFVLVSSRVPADEGLSDRDEQAIIGALTSLRDKISRALGDAVVSFGTERVKHSWGGSDKVDLVVLVAKTTGVARELRQSLLDELLDDVAASRSKAVRQKVTVSFR